MNKLNRISTTAERLKKAMEDVGKKQADLANETGLNRATISRYLSGEFEPKQDAIYKLAIALDCSEMWLWGYDVPKERPEEQKKIEQKAAFHAMILKDEELLKAIDEYYTLSEDMKEFVRNMIHDLARKKEA